jgi:hypothetical protein
MTPERWQKVKETLAAVLEAPASDRAACLEKVTAGDDSLRHEVELLLQQNDQMNSQFLDETSLAEAPRDNRSSRVRMEGWRQWE